MLRGERVGLSLLSASTKCEGQAELRPFTFPYAPGKCQEEMKESSLQQSELSF